ncbi:hypothetical protein AVEN_165213-1 [Araneus ventricosus]|uniref:RNase H type-1 domain-containing protein n=1 Tax=Araneus ventricosus TaxID=182803 RepID=A0A4Y2B5K8_ARAVE|nr:hypothetical protein AVEN_165213-1 [Araneus ventricosus]
MENVYKRCTYWKLSISPEKCAIADLSKRRLLSTPCISYAGSPHPWKDSIKYLEIIFSKTNQNGAIVKNLRAKPLKKINALKTIAYKSYGPRTKDLVDITNNGICSLFYYSRAITNKLSQTHFKICDTIQTIALRVALGLPIWTPNLVLLKIAEQEILSEKIKRLAIQFFTKQVANGVHSPLFLQSSNPCIQLNKKDQEAFAGLLADLNTTFDQIITLPNILDVLHKDICEIHLASFGFQDKAQPTSMIKTLFKETISEEFQDYFIIATDASKSNFYTSKAGTSNPRSFSFRIHPINSIFTAEALAIWQAIDDLSVPDSNLLILTDSFSVLQALKNLSINIFQKHASFSP